MEGTLILPRASASVAAVFLAAVAMPVSADVIEIADDGNARWIAGGDPRALLTEVVDPLTPAQSAALVEVSGELPVPEEAVANLADHSRGIPPQYVAKVHELSARYDLSPSLIDALVWQESRWRENAVSHAGARGLAQLMPGTARDLGVDPDDPMQNLEGGARYLRMQLNRFDGDLEKALAAYNAGPGRVIKAGGIPRIRETQLYVAAIMGRLSNYSRTN